MNNHMLSEKKFSPYWNFEGTTYERTKKKTYTDRCNLIHYRIEHYPASELVKRSKKNYSMTF